MKKAWNAMKEKRFDKRTKKLEKQALQYIQRNEKLERQIAESQRSKITKIMDEKSEEHTDKELNDDTRELEEDEKIMIQLQDKKTRKQARKRCHFCRKRGHLQKNCLNKKMLLKWLWNDASKKVKEHPAEMQSVEVTRHERQKNIML